jgi:type IV pilus assembly protein PilW
MMHPHMHRRPAVPRGLSLVELMVGVAIGLFITAAAAMLVSTQLSGNRQLLVETQIQQDLRATADLVTRDLRRASYSQNAPLSVSLLDSNGAPQPNQRGDILITNTGQGGSSEVNYFYDRGPNPGFSLRLSGDVLQRQISSGAGPFGGWQPLTDANVLKVTDFTVRPAPGQTIPVACPNLCADGTESCWPRMQVRELVITIDGESATGTKVRRSVQSTVRVRNDYVSFFDPTLPLPKVCP